VFRSRQGIVRAEANHPFGDRATGGAMPGTYKKSAPTVPSGRSGSALTAAIKQPVAGTGDLPTGEHFASTGEFREHW
jgi:hypothetical protein